jgi:DNA repair protein SbcC/Rad50
MRPLRLMLDGFGSYRKPAEADFSDVSFFALTGPTGSGKSTLIDGLCFALFGTVPRWGRENKIADALAPAASGCRVCLVFESAGNRYAAVRALARDKKGQVHTREARLDLLDPAVPAGAPLTDILGASIDQLAEGPDQVKAMVQGILGLTYEHFTQSVLLPQGRFSDFLQAEPRKRQDLLVELLAFGVYEKIGQRARDRARLAADRAQIAQQELNGLAGATEETEARAVARVEELDSLAGTVDGKLKDLGQLTERAREAQQRAEAVRTEATLLAGIRMPAEVPGLAQRITQADQLVADSEKSASEAGTAEEEAERVRGGLPDLSRTEALRGAYQQRENLTAQLRQQGQDRAAAADSEQVRRRELEAAESEAGRARAAWEAARRAHAAYALAEDLRAGDDCPVCLQPVATAPHHPAPPGLKEAKAAADAADRALKQAQTAHGRASEHAAVARSAADGTRQQLDRVTAELAGAPAESEVRATLDAIAVADERLSHARRDARARRADAGAAARARSELTAGEEKAWAGLHRARDSVVSLGAPAIGERDLAAAWDALTAWAGQQRQTRAQRLPELEAGADALQAQVTAGTNALTGFLADHGIGGVPDPAQAPAALARYQARAESDLGEVRRARARAAKLTEQIRTCTEEQHVAGEVGKLLRASAFERWLCSEALDSLVAEASTTLIELSAGQYELDRDDRNDLVVIDNQDAGARRPVHTLSGGETFQASLALALALSRQVVGLSAGLRDLDSMFLDEGFGTLDPETLETVATTLERLATDQDRMVGLVTHVAALAERVPVRFVISRDGTTSALRKERAT